MKDVIRILGIDPGLRKCGWGIIATGPSGHLGYLASGLIEPGTTLSLASRLACLHDELLAIIAEWSPHCAAVEEVFVNANPRSALKLGQARGICLMSPAQAGLEVAEYPANTIKKSVVGVGHADKAQIQAMVRRLLPKSGTPGADIADALAVAICHAHHAPQQMIARRHA